MGGERDTNYLGGEEDWDFYLVCVAIISTLVQEGEHLRTFFRTIIYGRKVKQLDPDYFLAVDNFFYHQLQQGFFFLFVCIFYSLNEVFQTLQYQLSIIAYQVLFF